MPTYSYACGKCEHVFEVFHSMSANPEVMCAKCGKGPCVKQLGTGAGFIFKGSGFYETDFKDKKGTKEVEPKSEPKGEPKGETKGETKSEPVSESKSEPRAEAKSEVKAEAKPEKKPAASKSAAKAPAKPRAKKAAKES